MFPHTEPKKSASSTLDFESVYLTYRNLMFHVARDILHNNADAEDAVQLACIKIAENLDKIEEINSTKTKGYIITIVENKAIALYRQNTKQQHLEYSESHNAFTFSWDIKDGLAKCILALPPLHREIIMLKHYYGYKTQEIADLLDISIANAYKSEQRAKKELKELCKKEGVLE